ncbi:polysaccharide biosynthesis protein [Edwardsiella ictaluri]|uniref:polysaccharide biosynthesis protein n=1 Tax=Edwardsiella ictaluri TaxID=67780 RepID=UPI0009C0EE6E|nr:polysaccharide biosynthesis protein [Edwardsiella ictaluri]ARD39313.1 polysaccharide biosynthesis protein [Edwardsiella ictaluri]
MFIKQPASPGADDDVNAEWDEHLRFYQLCGVMAAASSVLLTFMMVLMFPADFKGRAFMLAGSYLGPVTLLLLVGMLRFPRSCSWALFIGFNVFLLYLFLRGTAFNLLISFLFVLFFLFGAVAATQRGRRLHGGARPLWLARRGWLPVSVLILLALSVSSFSSGFVLRWLERKLENPLLWIEYRHQMLVRYLHLSGEDTSDAPGILRRVRLEGRTLVFVYRVRMEAETASEDTLQHHAMADFRQHCHERGVRQFGMKVMYVYQVLQEERILVLSRRDCVE